MKKILITGGHAGTTALAVIDELSNSKKEKWDISWVGTKKAIEGTDVKTLESDIFKAKNINYFEITAGRLQRRRSKKTLSSILKVPIGFWQSSKVVSQITPHIVLSFGGFVSLPVVINAWIRGIPVIIHEQTIAIGLANKLCSYFAEKIAVARIESTKYVDEKKVVHTGNPLLESVKKTKRKKNSNVLYITGGSRGAQIINATVFESISTLITLFDEVIHQTGELDYEKALSIQSSLSKKAQKKYIPVSRIDPDSLHTIYEKAHIVVGRSGANTVAELIYLSIPCVLIPIPWTRYDEQRKNAQLAKKAGIAIILEQRKLNAKSLISSIKKIQKNYKHFSLKQLETVSKDSQASKLLVELIESVL